MAGRKKSGEVSPVYAGGFGPTEFEGKDRKRTAGREWSHFEREMIRYAVAYRLEEYKQAGKLTAMLRGHPREWYCKNKVRPDLKGDVLQSLQGQIAWAFRGPIDKPFEYTTDPKTGFIKGEDWLKLQGINGRSLWQILEDYELPAL